MKTITLALVMLLAFLASGCANKLPKPVNADGSTNPSVAVAEATLLYRNVAHDATAYVATCHANPATIGCDDRVIAQIKTQNEKVWELVQAAETAVKTLQPGDKGIDRAINQLQAALVFLQSLVPHAKAKVGYDYTAQGVFA